MTSGPKWAASTSNISFGCIALSRARALNRDAVALLQVFFAFDLFLDLEKPLEKSLGSRRTAGHVDIDGDDLVDPFAHRIGVLKETAAVRAAAHRDDVARLGHLVVEALHAQSHLVGERACDDDEVARAGARARRGTEAFEVGSRTACLHELDRAAGEPEEQVPHA